MKKRTRIYYRIEIDDGCEDEDIYWLFCSFRAGRNFLLKVNDEFATLRRMRYKASESPGDCYAGLPLASWMVNRMGKMIRFDRKWTAIRRKRAHAAARAKRVVLTHNGKPYTVPLPPPDPDDIPF